MKQLVGTVAVMAASRIQYEDIFIREVSPMDRRQFIRLVDKEDIRRLEGHRISHVIHLRGASENPDYWMLLSHVKVRLLP